MIKSIKMPFLNEFNTKKIVEEFNLKLRIAVTPFGENVYYYKEGTEIKLCKKSIQYEDSYSGEEETVREIFKCFTSIHSDMNFRLWDFYHNNFTSFEDRFTVKQYDTNAKDSEGKNIFEGDILQNDKGEKFRVYNRPGGFCISNLAFDDTYYCDKDLWWLTLQPLADEQTLSYVSGSCKIIGNIFQNPELIKR